MATWIRPEWLAEVLDEHLAALELFAAQWSDSPEDAVQEAVIELARQPAMPNDVAAWLFHVVRLRAISSNRSASRRRRHESLAARLVRCEVRSPQAADFDADQLAAALARLDDEIREIVMARIWGGLGFAAIAEMTGLSTSTAFRRFEAGVQSLRDILEGSCKTT